MFLWRQPNGVLEERRNEKVDGFLGYGECGGEPIGAEGDTGPIVIDKNTKVYVCISGGSVISQYPEYNYFQKKDCKNLSNVSIEEVTAGEAIARGKSMCPYCFR